MHHAFVALDPDGNDVRTDVGFEDQPRDAPLEIAHCVVCALVDFAFGEDMDPAVPARGECSGGGEGVEAVGGVG